MSTTGLRMLQRQSSPRTLSSGGEYPRAVALVAGRQLEIAWWRPAAPAGAPLVLLHEGLGSVSTWRDFPEALAKRTARPVMAYSRFGHGRSDPPARPHTVRFMHDEAALLPDVLDAAQIDRAMLVGHSDGGSIALIAAARFPARVEALVLEAPHVFVEDISIESIQRTTSAYDSGDLEARLARHHADVEAAFRGWSDVWLDPAFREWNLEAFLRRITRPMLLIQGDRDEYGTLAQIEAIARQAGGPVETLVLPTAATCRIAIGRTPCWRPWHGSRALPERRLELGDRDLDAPEIGEHPLRLLDRLAQRGRIRRPAASHLPRQIARRLGTGAADGHGPLVRLDQLPDLGFLVWSHRAQGVILTSGAGLERSRADEDPHDIPHSGLRTPHFGLRTPPSRSFPSLSS
jgi:pimeloyl-ACP methyl ester carboxylesterase